MLRRARRVAPLLAALASACSLDAVGTAVDDPLGETGVQPDADVSDVSVDATIAEDTRGEDAADADGPGDDGSIPDTWSPDTLVPDTGTPDTLVPDTGTPDTGTPDTGAPDACSLAACGAAPSGAKRVALVDRTIACPPGFTTTDVLEAKAGDGCGCSCSVSSSPTCPGAGVIPTKYGTTSACASTGATLTSAGSGTCSSLGFSGTLSAWFSATAPGPVGGACASTPTTDKNAVSRPRRLCEPTLGACAGDTCKTPFTECIEIAGACPAAFPNARTVGTDVIVTCPACTCSVSASCKGEVTLYGNGGCGGSGTTLAVDGTCVSVPSSAGSVSTFKYTPDPPGAVACAASYTTAPGTRTFVSQRNLCCR